MPDLFASANAVLRRAKHHIDDFEIEMERFRVDKPYVPVVEYDPGFQKHVFKVRFEESRIEDLACIMFDAVSNLRACLDHMTEAIAQQHRGASANYAYFPICKGIAFWGNRINGMKDDLPAEICALFTFFKPYKGGDNTIWALNEIVNVKKHARLIKPAFGLGAILSFPSGRPPAGEFLSTPQHLYRKDEIVIMSMPEGHPVPQVNLSPTIVLDHPDEIIGDKQPIAVLYLARDRVSSILRDTTEMCAALRMMD